MVDMLTYETYTLD